MLGPKDQLLLKGTSSHVQETRPLGQEGISIGRTNSSKGQEKGTPVRFTGLLFILLNFKKDIMLLGNPAGGI